MHPSAMMELEQAPAAGADESPRIPGYQILKVLGYGGMGVVYQARQVSLERLVTLKMLRSESPVEPRALAHLQKEAEAMARLRHPNIVQIYEFGIQAGQPYLALEFVDGPSLAELPSHGALEFQTAARLVATLAQAVHYIHQCGIVHGDLKPANVLMDTDGTPKIIDFGLAKLRGQLVGEVQPGQPLGTPRYMAPEQAAGRIDQIGPQTDVHALGVLLYELLTGEPPFAAANLLQVLQQVTLHPPVPPRRLRPQLPRVLEAICLKCLEKDPSQRFASAAELAGALEPFRTANLRRRRAVRAALALVFLGLAAGSAALLSWTLHGHGERPAVPCQLGSHALEVPAAQLAETATAFTHVVARPSWPRDLEERPQPPPVPLVSAPLPAEPVRRTVPTMTGSQLRRIEHPSAVWSVTFSPDGRRFASGSVDRTIRILETATCNELLALRGHTGAIWSVAFSPDGRLLVSTSGDHQAKLWDTVTGQEIRTFRGHSDWVTSAAFHPDGTRVATASRDQTVRIWDVRNGHPLLTLQGHGQAINSVAFSPDGRRLASAGGTDAATDGKPRGEVKVWDAATGRELLRLDGHTGPAWSVAFSPDGSRLATGGADQAVRLWDAATGRELRTLRGHTGEVLSVTFAPDGRHVVSASHDQTVREWDTGTGEQLVIGARPKDSIYGLAYSPDGSCLAASSGHADHSVWIVPRSWGIPTAGQPPAAQPGAQPGGLVGKR